MDSNLQIAFGEVNTQLHALRTLVNGDNPDNSAARNAGQLIDDSVTTSSKAWSGLKVQQVVDLAKTAVKDELINGADGTMDTFLEAAAEFAVQGGDIATALAGVAANSTLATAANNLATSADAKADTAITDATAANAAAVAANNAAVAADAKAVANTTALNAHILAVGPTDTNYAALVSAGL